MPKSATRLVNQSSNGLTALSKPYCSSSSGVVPGTTTPDRRVLTVAVVNCQAEGVGGRTADVHVTKWIDMFLVEPSLSRTRTEASDVYGEIIGETELGGGGGPRGNTGSDRKSVGWGQSVSLSSVIGGGRIIQQKICTV